MPGGQGNAISHRGYKVQARVAVARAGGQARSRSERLRAGQRARSGEASWRERRRRLSWWTAAASGENRMPDGISQRTPEAIAAEIDAHIRGLVVRNMPGVRAVRSRYSRMLAKADPAFVLAVSRSLLERYGLRSVAYELILHHKAALQRIGPSELEELGRGIDSWWSVDSFARTLAGPAWREGYVGDDLFVRWARSHDRWWRRAALVSTVALNVRSKGGHGNVGRTLKVCRLLVDDHDDMVAKAMSWALRELIVHDPAAVRGFLERYADQLAARVKRQVRNKLEIGLKNPTSGVSRTRRSKAGRQQPRTQLSRREADRQ